MIREIVSIDEELCNGCGDCVPSCAEGAIQIIDGKAKLVSDTLCDGLGACLGHCPQGAIKIERREASAFDEAAVQRHLAGQKTPAGNAHAGCPSGRFTRLDHVPSPGEDNAKSGGNTSGTEQDSELTHWPVQLRLLPPTAPVLRGARVLIAADCVPVAYAGFHSQLLRDHAAVIACPKLDDPTGYVEKLTEMIRHNDLAEITVARMEVPCCAGILQMVLQACQIAESEVQVYDVLISTHGKVLEQREIPTHPIGSGNCESARCPNMRS
ncbi:MAG: 4Fe-4S binding protein [Phycisphaerales bacterium]|nr:MAG: 4Fe-4S binding protein [Phycisphaerales bacterium]